MSMPRAGRVYRRIIRYSYMVAGIAMLALAILGALLPLMPTTVFLILAAGCFARASPRLEDYLLRHSRFGPVLVAWREQGAISRRGKLLASLGMALGLCFFVLGARPAWWLFATVAILLSICTGWLWTRPLPHPMSATMRD